MGKERELLSTDKEATNRSKSGTCVRASLSLTLHLSIIPYMMDAIYRRRK